MGVCTEERNVRMNVVVTYPLEKRKEMSRIQVSKKEAVTLYLRKTRIFKNGKEHLYWSLVESIRTARGPRQKTVACLGELNEKQQKGWKQVANQVDGKPIIRDLFDREEDRRVEAVQIGKVRV